MISTLLFFIAKKLKIIIISIPFLWITSILVAQDVMVLTLEESIEIALDKSYSIKQLEQSNLIAELGLKSAKSAYNTNIISNFYVPMYNEGFKLVEVTQGTPVPKQFGDFQIRGVLDINQPMPWMPLGGGTLTFRSEAYQINSWDPTFDLKSDRVYTSLSLRLDKPLFTINRLALNLKQAELAFERQSRYFKRTELDLVYQVTSSFLQLYRREQQHLINLENVTRQEEIYRTTKNKFDAGLIAEVDAMQAEVDLIQFKNDLKSSEGALEEQEASFKQLIGIPLNTKIKVITELELKPIVVEVEKAIGIALQNRSEIAEKKIDIENQKINIKEIDAAVSVEGNVNGYYDFSGFSTLDYGATTAQLFESSWEVLKQTPNRGITFTLSIPIWDWGKNKADVQSAEASLDKEELNLNDLYITIEREVRDVVRSLYEAFDRVQMLEKSKEVSEKSFNISLQRFANGDITSIELARASEQLNNAKITYLSAYNEYKLALADLKRKTLYDFENDKSLVE
jgi:outer membrane protein TolC